MTEGAPAVKDCTSGYRGGGIFAKGSTAIVNFSKGEISGNKAASAGGGIRMDGAGTLKISGTALISGNELTNAAPNGGAGIHNKGAVVTISGGEIKDHTFEKSTNAYNTMYGAGIYNESGTVNITGGTISGNTVKNTKANGQAFGGAIANKATLNISGGTITGNKVENTASGTGTSAKVYGGAVYNASDAVMTLTGGTFTGNTSSHAGAAIYLAAADGSSQAAVLNISKAPVFGDGSTGKAANTVTIASLEGKTNGTSDTDNLYTYPDGAARQDIYLAETAEAPASLVIAGDLTDSDGDYIGDGSIWVWAESDYHGKQLMPFGTYGTGISFEVVENGGTLSAGKLDAAHLKAFRNARDDDYTENATDTYLYGTLEGDNARYVYWTGIGGSRKVILRKVDSTYAPVGSSTDASKQKTFTVYKGSSTTAYVVKTKNTDGTTTNETLDTDTLKSLDSGVIWIGELPYGWYIIKEDDTHYFYLTVTASGTYGTSENTGGYTTRAAAETAAKSVYDEHK